MCTRPISYGMNATDAVFFIAILVMSVVIHEISHGFMADSYGDKTARMAGRLTLNPLKHLDIFGSIIFPALLYFTSGFVLGWAKPVPYNPNNLSDRKWGTVAVASAGVLANLAIAVFFGLILRFFTPELMASGAGFIISTIVVINLGLAIFNLVPIPPLDGSKILFSLLPNSTHRFTDLVERYQLILIIIFVFFFSQYLSPILFFLYSLITGLPFT